MEQSIKIEILDEPDKCWNKRLQDSGMSSIYQTKEFGLARKLIGFSPQFLIFTNSNGKIIGQNLIFLSKHRRNLNRFLKSKSYNSQDWYYGPTILDGDYMNNISVFFIKHLLKTKSKIRGTTFPMGKFSFQKNSLLNLKNYHTFILDLRKGHDDIWNSFEKNSLRKNIKRSSERGVIIQEIKRNDLENYLQFLKKTNKIIPFKNEDDFYPWWKIMQSIGSRTMIGLYNDQIVSTTNFSFFGGYANEFTISVSELDRNQKLYSQDLLKWEFIKDLINKKFNFYDFSGVSINPTDSHEKGIFNYKKKWGGELIISQLITNF